MIDVQTFVIGLGLIVNAIAVGWNIIETHKLHEQAISLQVSNSNLQSEVNRLSVHLNQEIVRLNRLNELTRGMYLSALRRNQKLQLIASDPTKNAMARIATDEFLNEMTDTAVTFHVSTIEMKAIANVVGDSELLSLIEKLRTSAPTFDMSESDEARWKRLRVFGEHATALMEKVYQLLEEATDKRDADERTETIKETK